LYSGTVGTSFGSSKEGSGVNTGSGIGEGVGSSY
jgi:hypothetical protein